MGIHLQKTAGPQQLYLGTITLAQEEPRFPTQRQPLVDELGQWAAREWEGKTTSDAFLGTWLTVALEENAGAVYPQVSLRAGRDHRRGPSTPPASSGRSTTRNAGGWWIPRATDSTALA